MKEWEELGKFRSSRLRSMSSVLYTERSRGGRRNICLYTERSRGGRRCHLDLAHLGFARRAVCTPRGAEVEAGIYACTPSGAEVDAVVISTSLISASLDEQSVHRAEPRWRPEYMPVHRAEARWTPLSSRPRSSRLRSMSSVLYTERSRGDGLFS